MCAEYEEFMTNWLQCLKGKGRQPRMTHYMHVKNVQIGELFYNFLRYFINSFFFAYVRTLPSIRSE